MNALCFPLPAIAAISTAARDNDAELLDIGKRFEPLYRRWTRLMTAESNRQFDLEMAVEKALGVKLVDVPVAPGADLCETDEQTRKAYYAARCKVEASIISDCGDDSRRTAAIEKLQSAIDEIASEILSFSATTREGIALQTRVLIYHHHEAIAPTLEWGGEAEDECLRAFLASLARFAGVAFPPFPTSIGMLLDREGRQ